MKEVEGLWDAQSLARRLGVPLSWVYAKSAAGVLPSLKIGRYVRFSPPAIEEWLERQAAGTGGGR